MKPEEIENKVVIGEYDKQENQWHVREEDEFHTEESFCVDELAILNYLGAFRWRIGSVV